MPLPAMHAETQRLSEEKKMLNNFQLSRIKSIVFAHITGSFFSQMAQMMHSINAVNEWDRASADNANTKTIQTNIIHKSLTQFLFWCDAKREKKSTDRRILHSPMMYQKHHTTFPLSLCLSGRLSLKPRHLLRCPDKFHCKLCANAVYSFKTHQNIIKSHLIFIVSFSTQLFSSLRFYSINCVRCCCFSLCKKKFSIWHSSLESVLFVLPSKTMKVHIF